jgi:hypothetical protein
VPALNLIIKHSSSSEYVGDRIRNRGDELSGPESIRCYRPKNLAFKFLSTEMAVS